GLEGGPFSPSSFSYQLSASNGSLNYSITGVPSWLSASSTSGTVTTSPATITFTLNASANSLSAAGYGPSAIGFINATNGLGNTTRIASLVVNPRVCALASQLGDLNRDRRDDLVFRRATDGMVSTYLMNGTQIVSAQLIGALGTEWTLIAVADF